MRILLTGANGLFGQHVLTILLSKPGVKVFATGMGSDRNSAAGYQYFPCDLTQQHQVKELIHRVEPNYIIHAAAKTQVDWCEEHKELCWENNVQATESLLEASQLIGSRFQYISTDFVFDGERGNYIETDQPNPVNYYGKSKLEAEKLVISSGLSWSIARTVLVYGVASQMSRSNILVWIYNSLKNRQHIRVVTDQIRTPTFVEDLAMGSWHLLDKQAEGIFHISGDEIMTPYDLACSIAAYFDFDKNLIEPVDASSFSQAGKRPQKTGFVIEKARKILGFTPGSLNQNISLIAKKLEMLEV